MEPRNALKFRILGPTEVTLGGEPLDLGAPKQRALFVLLLLRRGQAVSTDRLVDELWGDRAPAAAAKSVQVYVSGLRKVLPDGTIQTRGHAYSVEVDSAPIDSERFEDLADAGRRELEGGDPQAAAATLRKALGLWRGPALADFTYDDFAQDEIARLDELRLAALENRIDADLALGRHADVVAELTTLVAEHPVRERMCGQLMLALYRSGRQADALEAYQACRQALVDERGLEPGPALRELQAAILRQDTDLGAPTRMPARLARSRRRGGVLIAAGGALVLVAAIAAAVLALGGDDGAAPEPLSDGLAAIPGRGGGVGSFTSTRAVPGNIAVGEGAVWMLDSAGSGTVSRVDPKSRKVVKTFKSGGLAAELAAGEGAVWVGNVGGQGETNAVVRVTRMDPATGKVTGTARLPGAGNGVLPTAGLPRLAVGAGAVWAIGPDGRISRIEPRSGKVVATIRPKSPAWTIAAGDAGVWFLSFDNDSAVTRIDPRRNRLGQSIEAGSPLLGIAVGDGSVWATSREEGLLWRIEPGRRPVTRTVDVGPGATAVAYGERAVWTSNYITGTVSRVDPSTNRVSGTTPVDAPQALAAGAGNAWVTVAGRTTKGPLRTSVCGEVASAGGRPDVLIASDLPLQGPNSGDPRAMASAIRFVLERHGFRAGPYTVGYQGCDVSTAETGGFEFRRCAANGNAYAHTQELVAVVGTFSSFCAEIELPILNRARGGPVPMVGPSTTGPNLTRGGPLAYSRGQPGIYYPAGVRSFVRVVPREDLQGIALAMEAKRLGLKRVAAVYERGSEWDITYADPFRRAARRIGLDVTAFVPFDPGGKDAAAVADKVVGSGAQAVLIGGQIEAGGLDMLKAIRARGARVRVMIADPFAPVPDLIKQAGPAAKGVYMSATDIPPGLRDLTPAGERFARDFGALNRPTSYALPAAQATEVVLDAIARSDGTRASVLSNLRRTQVKDGILGSFRFDRNGDITPAVMPIFRITGQTPPGTELYPYLEGAELERTLTVPGELSG